MKFVCENCKGTNIQTRMWVDPNTNEVIDSTSDGDSSDNWCNDCEEHVKFDQKEDE